MLIILSQNKTKILLISIFSIDDDDIEAIKTENINLPIIVSYSI